VIRTLGIIGGIGPESTIDYYRRIVAAYRTQTGDGSYPPIIINSIDLKKMLNLVEVGDFIALTSMLLAEIQKLARAGADFSLLASNTPHIVFDELRRRSDIPVLSIVEATCEKARTLGFTKLGLFGSRFAMQGHFYQDVFSKHAIALVTPEPSEQTYIHEKYMGELVNGIFLPETRSGLLEIAQRLQQRHGIQGLILGGTELPLIMRDVADCGISFLDTTQIHVNAAVRQLLF
jgi:aspartate racemase